LDVGVVDREVEFTRDPHPFAIGRLGDAAFLPLHLIEAVSIHDAPKLGASRSDAPPPPTRLEFKRAVAKIQEKLTTAVGQVIVCEMNLAEDAPADGMRALSMVASRLQDAIGELASEQMGREALAEKVKTVRFGLSSGWEVTLSDGVLSVSSGTSLADVPAVADLRSAIEAAL
jgi:hypothetical protein